MTPIKEVEVLLNATTGRSIYYGRNVYKDLTAISEKMGLDQAKAQDYVTAWMMMIDHEEIYRRNEIQDRLLDLWSILNEESKPATPNTEEVSV